MVRMLPRVTATLLLLAPIVFCLDQPAAPTVDLGYAVYQGIYNSTTGLNTWNGIRYADPPTGKQRWQAPRRPQTNRTLVRAETFGSRCPQALNKGTQFPDIFPGSEDCLFLNVYSPAERQGCVPVLVYIHGGGYGVGDGTQDMTTFLNSTGNRFVVVSIQYRLGVFGFMSSAEVKARGVLNAGLLDQAFALAWIQDHISQFGGDPAQVTIFGESAGGGSVLQHAIAHGGTVGTKMFKNGIAASPYLPTQPVYNDTRLTERYYAFASALGCPSSGPIFDCLLSADSQTMQTLNYNFSNNYANVAYGDWAFIPVIDYSYITQLPSAQLAAKQVNGVRMLTTNNANEGPGFVPHDITTEDDFVTWLKSQYPYLSAADTARILAAYPTPSAPDDPNSPKFETNGYGPATAVNVSQVATGHQQRAYNVYAEVTFSCPSYWLATAFDRAGRAAYHYQYSVPFAIHSADFSSLFGPPTVNQPPEFNTAFREIFADFILSGNPSIPNAVANGASSPNPNRPNPASNWPRWTDINPQQIVLNISGGVPYVTPSAIGVNVTQFEEPGLLNNFTVANAYTWEGGRGARCDMWRSLGPVLPE